MPFSCPGVDCGFGTLYGTAPARFAAHCSIICGIAWTVAGKFGTDPSGELIADVGYSSLFLLWILPAFFTSIWIWLYAGSGFILKAARRYDIGFEWFNRKLDIGKKPLQSIGLVAGVLVALVYWAVIAISRIV